MVRAGGYENVLLHYLSRFVLLHLFVLISFSVSPSVDFLIILFFFVCLIRFYLCLSLILS